jgi:DNA repair exonuclease SbcCD ATPase subunit
VTTYKEDFDTERKDREKILREKNEFQETIRNVLDENDQLRAEVNTLSGPVVFVYDSECYLCRVHTQFGNP